MRACRMLACADQPNQGKQNGPHNPEFRKSTTPYRHGVLRGLWGCWHLSARRQPPRQKTQSLCSTAPSRPKGSPPAKGTTFYAGDLQLGDIYRGDIRSGKAELFIDVSNFDATPRAAVGMKADVRNDLLFVAGGATGKAYVYDTASGEPVKDYTLAPGFINDVTLTDEGAWFTNSVAAELYFVPVGRHGKLGKVQTLTLTGPAAEHGRNLQPQRHRCRG